MTETRKSEELIDLTAEKLLGADDMKIEPVDVPEWGGRIYVRRLTGRERDEFEQLMHDRRAGRVVKVDGVISRIVCTSACDASGSRLFKNKEDENRLNEKACGPLRRVFDAALKVSGMRDDDIENLSEGLEPSPSASSGSA